MKKQSIHDFINSQQDNVDDGSLDYKGKIFEKTLSKVLLDGDKNRTDILAAIENVVYQTVEEIKNIKNFFNYAAPKNNKRIR
jgi:hypothetical protein